ncbi:MAG: Fpg/Nei family DNA glycosylase [Planctomycetaceae bacterium]|nr:Fpg/Nei family DNA glycosylase [Planctomycetaceae bacterium]
MPEGDTIFRTATRLRAVLDGQKLQAAESRQAAVDLAPVVGQQIVATEAKGKHLLLHFDSGHVLHSHMGMTGAWHIYATDQPWQKAPRLASVVLKVRGKVCVCFSPKQMELLTASGLRRHAYLSRLGPDLLGEQFCVTDAIARCRVHDLRPIGESVMNQTIVCGIGNIYKSEVLFLTHVNPFATGRSLTDEQWRAVLLKAQQLMKGNRRGYPRRTRFGQDGQRLWVYGRSKEPCLRCGTRIQMRRQGDLGRSTYWCVECQS